MECFWLTEKICILIQNIFCQYLFFNFANKDWTGGMKINFKNVVKGMKVPPRWNQSESHTGDCFSFIVTRLKVVASTKTHRKDKHFP